MSGRPDPTSMEGMIWNANHVLEQALKPNINGIPKKLFEDAVGIVLVNTVQLGFIFSGTMGSGIALYKRPDGKWSPPCAVGMSGLGFGLLVGMSAQDLMVFVFDDETMQSLGTKHGAQIGAQLELTIGPFGRAAKLTDVFSKGGYGPTFCMAYSKGIFGGFSADGAKLGTREFVNNKFYGTTTTAKDILFTEGSVTVPQDKVTMLQEVYDKLDKLQAGASEEPDAAAESKKTQAKQAADEAAESIKAHPEAEVVQVDAAAEAAKES